MTDRMMRFALAPMDMPLRVLTSICVAIPLVISAAALRTADPARFVLFGAAAFVVTVYLIIWCYLRPTAFVISTAGLAIEWPVRRRMIDAASIVGARVLDRDQLRDELGHIVRIGAGGLGGGFGLARTKLGLVELWVSRTDRMVLVECSGRRSLLLTPEDPERFARDLLSQSQGKPD